MTAPRTDGVRGRRRARVVAAVCALIAAAGACTETAERFRPMQTGDEVPAYQASRLTKDTVRLADLRGQMVVLNVWATWCVPCRREMPLLDSLDRQYRAKGVSVVGVSVDGDGSDEEVKQFLAQYNIGFTILRDPQSQVSRTFQTRGVPETFLIDRQGRLAHHWIGGVDTPAADVRGVIDRVLGTQEPVADSPPEPMG